MGRSNLSLRRWEYAAGKEKSQRKREGTQHVAEGIRPPVSGRKHMSAALQVFNYEWAHLILQIYYCFLSSMDFLIEMCQ